MSKRLSGLLTAAFACVTLSLVASTHAQAMNAQLAPSLPSMTVTVSGGCGPYGWRGPWGHCNYQHFYGGAGWDNRPAYYGGPAPGNGCPPGFWRGPWGHCRNTPYHGRLPGGGWQ
jgi:hypothetical protein